MIGVLCERARIHSFGRSLGRKLLLVFSLTNAQLDLTKRTMSSNGSANVKHSEAMSDEIVTVMSTACGISYLNCLKKTYKAFVVLVTK